MNSVEEILGAKIWEPTAAKEQLFSSDHVIEAYLKGKEDGLGQAQKLIFDRLSKNVTKAGDNTYEVINLLRKNSITPETAYLRINTWDELEILITIAEDQFVSQKFLECYNSIYELENKFKEELYNIQFVFTDSVDSENDSLESDGYLFKLSLKDK